jgi:PadR family transcriptional regulator PadR
MVPSHAYIFAPSATGRYPLEGIENKEMKVENTKAQMRKGVLEYCILSLLSAEEMYPGDLIAKLKEAKLIVVEGTLYPLLTRLKDSGYLNYRWEESRSGPPRKYYKLTPVGGKFLKELDETWAELVLAVKKATRNNPSK